MNDSVFLESYDNATFADRQLSRHQYVMDWADRNPKEALLGLLKDESIYESRFLYEAVVSKWLEQEPEQFFATISSLGNDENQLQLIEIASGILGADFSDSGHLLIQQYVESAGGLKAAAMHAYYAAMAKSNPEQLKITLAGLPAGPLRSDAMIELADRMAQDDPVAALEWYRSLDATEDNSSIFSALVGPLVSQNPFEAEQLLLDLSEQAPGSDAYFSLASGIVKSKAVNDFYGAVQWADQHLTNDDAYHSVLGEVGEEWIRKDPIASLKDVANWEDPDMRDAFLDQIAMSDELVTQITEDKAIEVINLFPEGVYRRSAIENVVLSWFDSSPEKITSLIDMIDDPEVREMAIFPYVENLNQYSEDAAWQYVASLRDPMLRNRLTEEIFNQE